MLQRSIPLQKRNGCEAMRPSRRTRSQADSSGNSHIRLAPNVEYTRGGCLLRGFRRLGKARHGPHTPDISDPRYRRYLSEINSTRLCSGWCISILLRVGSLLCRSYHRIVHAAVNMHTNWILAGWLGTTCSPRRPRHRSKIYEIDRHG